METLLKDIGVGFAVLDATYGVMVQAALVAKNRLTASMLRWLDLVSGTVLIVWGLWIMAEAL